MREDPARHYHFAREPSPAADVVVVGGGIAGVSAALHLADCGVAVQLLERDAVGSGATSAAAGVLFPPLRQPFHETVRLRGVEFARDAWSFALRSVAGLAAALEEHGLADEAGLDRSGACMLAESDTLEHVRASFDALQGAGLPAVWLSAEDARARTGGGVFTGGWHLEGFGSLDPAATTRGLARIAAAQGAHIVEGVEVLGVDGSAGRLSLETSHGQVRCEMVVYATHVHSRRFSNFLGDEVVPIRGQGLVTGPGAPRAGGAFATHWMMNSWRQDRHGAYVLSGWRWDSWDRSYWKMRPDLDDALQHDLQSWFDDTFPDQAPVGVSRRWGGIFGWAADHLPLVGPLPGAPRELVAAGFSGSGLAFAFEAGRLIASVVTGRDPGPDASLFNPRRFA